jgi:hypothetical protein
MMLLQLQLTDALAFPVLTVAFTPRSQLILKLKREPFIFSSLLTRLKCVTAVIDSLCCTFWVLLWGCLVVDHTHLVINQSVYNTLGVLYSSWCITPVMSR